MSGYNVRLCVCCGNKANGMTGYLCSNCAYRLVNNYKITEFWMRTMNLTYDDILCTFVVVKLLGAYDSGTKGAVINLPLR